MRFALSWTQARIDAVRQVTPTVRLFEIVPSEAPPLAHAPGSHINVGIIVDGRPDTRSYSLVGEADNRCYRIAVKRHPDSRGGSAYMWSLAEGARLNVSSPQALFGLDYGRGEYLLVAGGIGITPIVGMAKTLRRRGERVRLAYAARRSDELAFADELSQVLGADLQTFVSSEGRAARSCTALRRAWRGRASGAVRPATDARRGAPAVAGARPAGGRTCASRPSRPPEDTRPKSSSCGFRKAARASPCLRR